MKYFLLSLLLVFFSMPALAERNPGSLPEFQMSSFERLPVQHDGRIKPLDTFARGLLKKISGQESLSGQDASEWLAQTLFDPAQALHQPVFQSFRPDIIGLPQRESHRYSYIEIAPALQSRAETLQKMMESGEKSWSDDQRELARLQESAVLYSQLLRSFSYALPLAISVPEELTRAWKIDPQEPFTLQQFGRYQKRIEDHLRAIILKKGEDPSNYSEDEKKIATFAFEMQVLKQAGEDNIFFRIVPGVKDETWHSPWGLGQAGEGSPQSAAYLELWQDMAKAYGTADTATWDLATGKALQISGDFAETDKTRIEIFHNKAHPLNLALGLYMLSFLALIFYGMRGNNNVRLLSFFFLISGNVCHAAAIILRVVILSRPPVGTLYESIIFVALICTLVAALLESLKKDGNGIMIGSLSGLVLLFCAKAFAGEDTMQILVAVLNTNFWLATHVLCITMGYGFCLITAMLAHIWLYTSARGKDADALITPVKIMALVSLLFTAFGTILGGIWADQSWGRFWGWDPKENGALLIVLWLVWILHAHIAGQIGRNIYMAGMATLSVIVAIAWFGVNLLNVGLHSYGFISGVATSLGLFCAAEIALISGLCAWRHKK